MQCHLTVTFYTLKNKKHNSTSPPGKHIQTAAEGTSAGLCLLQRLNNPGRGDSESSSYGVGGANEAIPDFQQAQQRGTWGLDACPWSSSVTLRHARV